MHSAVSMFHTKALPQSICTACFGSIGFHNNNNSSSSSSSSRGNSVVEFHIGVVGGVPAKSW